MPFSSWSPWSPQRSPVPASVDAWTDARRRTHISKVIALGTMRPSAAHLLLQSPR